MAKPKAKYKIGDHVFIDVTSSETTGLCRVTKIVEPLTGQNWRKEHQYLCTRVWGYAHAWLCVASDMTRAKPEEVEQYEEWIRNGEIG